MATNLLSNAKIVLRKYPIPNCYGWSASTTVLFWLQDNNVYKPLVSNRLQKFKQQNFLQWSYVPTAENSADIGSRWYKGINIKNTWANGPRWLSDRENRPKQITIQVSQESDTERKAVKEIFKIAVYLENSIQYQLLEWFNLKKILRILSWVQRFPINCNIKERKKRSKGPLTTKELNLQLTKMIRGNQSRSELEPVFNEIKEGLILKKNKHGLYECCGRIIGDYPIFVLKKTLLAEKMVEKAHYQTLHGGGNLTMTDIRRKYCIPKLRQLIKMIIRTCHGCWRFHATAYVDPIYHKTEQIDIGHFKWLDWIMRDRRFIREGRSY